MSISQRAGMFGTNNVSVGGNVGGSSMAGAVLALGGAGAMVAFAVVVASAVAAAAAVAVLVLACSGALCLLGLTGTRCALQVAYWREHRKLPEHGHEALPSQALSQVPSGPRGVTAGMEANPGLGTQVGTEPAVLITPARRSAAS